MHVVGSGISTVIVILSLVGAFTTNSDQKVIVLSDFGSRMRILLTAVNGERPNLLYLTASGPKYNGLRAYEAICNTSSSASGQPSLLVYDTGEMEANERVK